MKRQFNIKIDITADEIKEIIAEHFNKNVDTLESNIKPEDIVFNVTETCVGYGPSEHMVTSFTGASVSVKGVNL